MKKSIKNSQKGFGVVEVMIALVLGLLLLAGMIRLFETTRVGYQTSQSMARIQEMGRFAMETIKPTLRIATRTNACIADLPIQNLLDPAGTGYVEELFASDQSLVAWNYQDTGDGDDYEITGFEAAGAANAADWSDDDGDALPDALADLAVPGSDILLVKSSEAIEGLTACNNNNTTSASININYGNCPGGSPEPAPLDDEDMRLLLPQQGLVLVTDCSTGGDLFQRTNQYNAASLARGTGAAGGDPGNAGGSSNWSTNYGDTTQVFSVHATAYFVGVDDDGNPGLYQIDFGQAGSNSGPIRLVDGVENLQILMGELQADDTVDYVTPEDVTDLDEVISVSMSILIRSSEGADGVIEATDFVLFGTTVSPQADNRLRKVFSTNVAVRNRVQVI